MRRVHKREKVFGGYILRCTLSPEISANSWSKSIKLTSCSGVAYSRTDKDEGTEASKRILDLSRTENTS